MSRTIHTSICLATKTCSTRSPITRIRSQFVASGHRDTSERQPGIDGDTRAAAAAVLLAFLEGVMQSFADPTVARIASLVLMSAVLLLRPHGLFKGLTR